MSKRLPEALRSYSELELCGLTINIASFSHLLKRVDFDAIVHHLALTYIIKSKTEPVTTRRKRLLELISSYSFNLYYMKGKDMIFLSRQTHDDSNPHKIIPVSFNMYKSLYESYYSIDTKEWYLVQTRLQTKLSRIALPEVLGGKKMLDANILPEEQKPQLQNKQVIENRSRLGQGRAGIRHRKPQLVDGKIASTSKSREISKIPMVQNVTKDSTDFPIPEQLIMDKTEAIIRGTIQDKNRDLPFNPDLIYRPPPRPPENLQPHSPESKPDIRPKIDVEFEENSLYQEVILSEFYKRPNKSYFQEPREFNKYR